MNINDTFFAGLIPPKDSAWIIEVFLLVFITLLLSFLSRKFIMRIHRQLEKTATLWDDAFMIAIRRPVRILIWILGISFAAEIALVKTDWVLMNIIPDVRNTGVIAAITWAILRFIKEAENTIIHNSALNNKELDVTTVDAVSKLIKVTIIITSSLVVLQTLGFSISGVLAFGGIGGVAVGFAAKDLLANFFGGLMVYLDRPFTIGDWIRSPDKSIEGTVEDIGWRQTRIRTFDKRPLYVPNSVFSTIVVENPSRMTNRRIYETIGVRYSDVAVLKKIIVEVKTMLVEHKEIDETKTLMVNFNEFAASSLDFFIYTFTHTTDWIKFHEIKQDVLFKIADIVEKHNAEMAFPTTTVHLETEQNIIKEN